MKKASLLLAVWKWVVKADTFLKAHPLAYFFLNWFVQAVFLILKWCIFK